MGSELAQQSGNLQVADLCGRGAPGLCDAPGARQGRTWDALGADLG